MYRWPWCAAGRGFPSLDSFSLDGFGLDDFSFDSFSLDIESLPGLAKAARPQLPVPHHMRCDPEFPAIGKWLDASVERGRRPVHLHMQSAHEKDRAQSESTTKPDPPPREICCGHRECESSHHPPRHGTPRILAGCDSECVGH